MMGENIESKIPISSKYITITDIIKKFKKDTFPILKKNKKVPIVSIMGHVDHGKTTLLDFIRSSHIAEMEIGNITQKIGAYSVKTDKGYITFLDTPGHNIFNNIRLSVIKVSDIIIVMIAANEGIKTQTIEVIKSALFFKIPIIIAINKIDLADSAAINIIHDELKKYEIIDESLGGDNFIVHISAKTGKGVSQLLETILLQRDLLELTSSDEGMVIGTVIESSIDKHFGPLASILIENGTLHIGDKVVCGTIYGKIKSIRDEWFKHINMGYPSLPIQILGLSKPPIVGDKLVSVSNDKEAKYIINNRVYTLNNFSGLKKEVSPSVKQINLIVKSASYGTLDVIVNYFDYLNDKYKDKFAFQIIHRGIGDINETDVLLSSNTKSKIIGFNIGVDSHVKSIIKQRNIEVNIYNIIYHLIRYIEKEFIEERINKKDDTNIILGVALVKNVFSLSSIKAKPVVVGCKIIQGAFKKDVIIQIYREDKLIATGTVQSLRRFKKNVKEVKYPLECGMSINNVQDIKIGDMIKAIK